jgi:hypothetical protein
MHSSRIIIKKIIFNHVLVMNKIKINIESSVIKEDNFFLTLHSAYLFEVLLICKLDGDRSHKTSFSS